MIDDDFDRAEAGRPDLLETLSKPTATAFGNDRRSAGRSATHAFRPLLPAQRQKKLEPRIAYHHPILDRKFGIDPTDDSVVISDDDLERLIDNYVRAAKLAQRVGFHFVDVKHCHGYLGHELLSAFTRPGQFGGSFENRTRFAREIIGGIQARMSRA